MKKSLLSFLIVLCLCSLSVYTANAISTTSSSINPNIEKTSQPPQDGRVNDKPAQEKPSQKPDKKPDQKPSMKPNKKPDKQPSSKPGGDKVPKEFQNSK